MNIKTTTPLVLSLLLAACAGPQHRKPEVKTRDPRGVVSFVQVTDMHIQDAQGAARAAASLSDIERLDPRPDFIIGTGDNINHGDKPEEVSAYLSAVSTLTIPYFTLAGNHDLDKKGLAPAAMTGEPYFSFDSGRFHFAALDAFGPDKRQPGWFARDLDAAALAGKRTVVFSHDLLGRGGPEGARLRTAAMRHKAGIIGVFAGHWHANRVFSDEGLTTLVTSPLAFGGIDGSLAGYRLAGLNFAGELSWEFVPSGMRDLASVTAYYKAADGIFNVVARYMDSSRRAGSVIIEGKDVEIPLEPINRYAFAAELPPGAVPSHAAVVFRDEKGAVMLTVPFEKPARKPAEIKPGSPWSTFHHDAARTGATADSPGPALKLAWAADTAGIPFSNSPVYDGGRVYSAAASWSSGAKPCMSAYDAESGALLWRTGLPSSAMHTPTVAGGAVSILTVNGELLALDPATGAVLASTAPALPPYKVHTSGATAADEKGRHIGGSRFHLSSADKTGAVAQVYTAAGADDWIPTGMTPALAGGKAYLGTLWRDGMWAIDLNASSAAPLGKYTESYGASPLADGTTLYLLANGKLLAYDTDSGKEMWAAAGFENSAATPALDKAGGALYAIDGQYRLAKVSLTDGAVLWRVDFAAPSGLTASVYQFPGRQALSSPAVSARCVWTADLAGNVYCISRDGKTLGSYALGAPTASSPAVSGNAVFISAMDGFLYALAGDK